MVRARPKGSMRHQHIEKPILYSVTLRSNSVGLKNYVAKKGKLAWFFCV